MVTTTAGSIRVLKIKNSRSSLPNTSKRLKAYAANNPNTTETITYYTRLGGFSPEKLIFVCHEEKIVGYCWVEIVPSVDNDSEQEGIIHMLGADPDYQGKGIGRKALMAGLAYLMKKCVKTASLSVDSKNRSACNLYRSIGFERRARNLWYEREVN